MSGRVTSFTETRLAKAMTFFAEAGRPLFQVVFTRSRELIRHSGFVIHSDFGFRHSDFSPEQPPFA